MASCMSYTYMYVGISVEVLAAFILITMLVTSPSLFSAWFFVMGIPASPYYIN